MRGQQLLNTISRETTDGLAQRHDAPSTPTVECEDIRVRNYDARPHKVALQISDATGTSAFEETYYVPEEATASIVNELESGEYTASVTVDGTKHAVADCRIDEGPTESILIELGNGIVNITDTY